MDNYKPNSNRYNELKAQQSIEEANSKKLESVVSGTVSMRKKTTLKKVADIFFQKEKTTAYTIPDALLFFLLYSKFFPLIRFNDFIRILSPSV